ncbi:terminase small subunit [Azospirillum sp. ST 5-10]|uniref:terminase small subunit n=1 Tax=unclassified Azospirillum TaxID=2630922 RepID=UPI003F4A350A
MPVLANALWERFARAYARGATGTNAAIEAGYAKAGAAARACEALKRPEVQARITELREGINREVQVQLSVDRQWVLAELAANVGSAKSAKDHSAVNRGLELIGKELGMFVDRKMDVRSPLESLTVAELKALASWAEAQKHGDGPVIDVETEDGVPKLGTGSQDEKSAET